MEVLDAQARVNIKIKVGLVALIALETMYNLSGTHGIHVTCVLIPEPSLLEIGFISGVKT